MVGRVESPPAIDAQLAENGRPCYTPLTYLQLPIIVSLYRQTAGRTGRCTARHHLRRRACRPFTSHSTLRHPDPRRHLSHPFPPHLCPPHPAPRHHQVLLPPCLTTLATGTPAVPLNDTHFVAVGVPIFNSLSSAYGSLSSACGSLSSAYGSLSSACGSLSRAWGSLSSACRPLSSACGGILEHARL